MNYVLHRILTLALVISAISCNRPPKEEDATEFTLCQGIDFSYNKSRGHLLFSPVVNDSIPATFLFDTGAKTLILKSSFFEKLDIRASGKRYVFLSGHNEGFYESRKYDDTISIAVADTKIFFHEYCVVEDDSPLGIIFEGADGLFPLPTSIKNLTLSFSRKRIGFDMGERPGHFDFSSSISENAGAYVIDSFPLSVPGSSESIYCDSLFIDTGYRGDFVFNGKILNVNVLRMINSCENRFELNTRNRFDAKLFLYRLFDDHLLGKEFWLEYKYLDSSPNNYITSNAIIGVEALKAFDIYIDFEVDSIWMKKIDYVSLLDEAGQAGEPLVAGRTNIAGEYTVMYMKSDSPYTAAGVVPGDRIVSVNDRPFSTYRDSIRLGIFSDTLNISVSRNGKFLTLSIPPVQTNTE